MPVFKDEERGTYYVKVYFTDWKGERRQKMKRGFKLKREAREWERLFIEQYSRDPEISFISLVEKYREYIRPRIKESSYYTKFSLIEKHIVPYFGKKKIAAITSEDVVLWQNELLKTDMKPSYMRSINVQLVAIFRYAVSYCGLAKSPCGKMVGAQPKKDNIAFWTLEEYKQFISTVDDIEYRTAFELLYYTGIRIGEMLALTPADLKNNVLAITKGLYRAHGKDIIGTPKTASSVRNIPIPGFVADDMNDYISRLYGIEPTDRIFSKTKMQYGRVLDKYAAAADVPKIHLHGLRYQNVNKIQTFQEKHRNYNKCCLKRFGFYFWCMIPL